MAELSYSVEFPSEPQDMQTTGIRWRLAVAPDRDTHTYGYALIHAWWILARHGVFGNFRMKDMFRKTYAMDPMVLEVWIDIPFYAEPNEVMFAGVLVAIDGWSRDHNVPIVDCLIRGDAAYWPDEDGLEEDWAYGGQWPYDLEAGL